MKYGNLNLLEASGPVQTCNGIALPYVSVYIYIYTHVCVCVGVGVCVCARACVRLSTIFYVNSVYIRRPKLEADDSRLSSNNVK